MCVACDPRNLRSLLGASFLFSSTVGMKPRGVCPFAKKERELYIPFVSRSAFARTRRYFFAAERLQISPPSPEEQTLSIGLRIFAEQARRRRAKNDLCTREHCFLYVHPEYARSEAIVTRLLSPTLRRAFLTAGKCALLGNVGDVDIPRQA